MQVEFDTMSALLEPGEHDYVYTHFGLSEDFSQRIVNMTDTLTLHVNQVVGKIHSAGITADTTECQLLKIVFGLVDEYVQPKSAAEIACTAYLVSTIMGHLANIMQANIQSARMREEAKSGLKPSTYYGGNAATA